MPVMYICRREHDKFQDVCYPFSLLSVRTLNSETWQSVHTHKCWRVRPPIQRAPTPPHRLPAMQPCSHAAMQPRSQTRASSPGRISLASIGQKQFSIRTRLPLRPNYLRTGCSLAKTRVQKGLEEIQNNR